MKILIFIILHWYLSAFCQTFFLHRYSAHKMFSLSRFWERFFYVATFLTQGSSYLNPRTYALMHRLHHAHSDTAKDPHSPLYYQNPLKMMWATLQVYLNIYSGKFRLEAQFEGNYPVWPSFDRIADSIPVRLMWAFLYLALYLVWAESAWLYLLLPLHIFMGPIHGAIVNWCGHKYGYSNFDNQDASKNTFFWDILTMGELMQNNHHRHGTRPNFAVKWFEFDPTYPLIRLLNLIGVVRFKS